MSVFGRVHAAGVTVIAVGFGLFRIALGLAMVAACGWLFANGFREPRESIVLGIIGIWGLTIIIRAMGVFVADPSLERDARRETRKALRRARMLRRW